MSIWPSVQPQHFCSTQAFPSCEPFRSSYRLTSQNRARQPLHRGTRVMRMMTATLVLLLLGIVPTPGRAASLHGPQDDLKPPLGGFIASIPGAVPAGPVHGTPAAQTVADKDCDEPTTTTRRVTAMPSRLVRAVSPTRDVQCAMPPVSEQTTTGEINR